MRSISTADTIAARFPRAKRIVEPQLGEMLYGALEGQPMAEVGAEIATIASRW